MAFTSLDLVRTHLDAVQMGDARIADIPITLHGTTPAPLPHHGVIASSIIVKALRSNAPTREAKTLSTDWVGLSHMHLVRGSAVVADDSSLGTVYIENLDFIIDYKAGRVKRITTGAITNGQTVSIWYDRYHEYVPGDDFSVNTSGATITRKSSGAIADGQTVLVDYDISLSAVTDATIELGIAESGETALALVNPVYHDAPTPAIVIGATHLAVASVARMRAAATLADASLGSSLSRNIAETWLQLAASYDQTAREFLARFSNPVASRSSLKRG